MRSTPSRTGLAGGLLLIAVLALAAPAQGMPIGSGLSGQSQMAAPDVTASFVVDPLMDSPHAMRVEATFEVDASVSGFRVRIYNSTQFGYATTIDSASGFEVGESGNYLRLEHDGETTTPTATYTVRKGPAGIGKGNPQPMIAGEDWVVFTYKGVTDLRYPPNHDVEATARIRTDLPVTRGNTGVLVGERTLHNHSGAKQDFTLVVPDAADMAADPEAVLDLMDATTQLFPGETPGERSYVFVLPENAVGEAPTALAISPDAFVAARSPINQAGHRNGRAAQSVWAHEVTHIQHMFSATKPPKMRWISEGHADYGAAYASYLQGIIPFDRFYNWTQHGYPGEEDRLHDDVLSKPSTHDGATLYSKGRRVTLALDAKIRQDTGGNRTVFDVFYLLDKTDDGVSLPEFKGAVEEVAGRSYDDWIDRYVTTSAAPTALRNESLFDSMPDSDIEAVEFTTSTWLGSFDASVTYHVDPLPDRPNTVRVRIEVHSERLSRLRVHVSNETAKGFETYVVAASGLEAIERDRVLTLQPAQDLNATNASATYVMTRSGGFPPPEEYRSAPEVLVDGVSVGPGAAEVTNEVLLSGAAAETSRENGTSVTAEETVPRGASTDTGFTDGSNGEDRAQEPSAPDPHETDGSADTTASDGQPGFTAITAMVAILVAEFWVRRRDTG